MSDLIFTEQGSGVTPPTGKRTLYYKSDGKLYTKDSTGTETSFPTLTDVAAAAYATVNGVQTLTNKTLTAPVINSPTGIVKADVGLGAADNTSDASKPVSTAQAAADTATLNTARSYADGLVIGLLDDRGNYNASSNTFPSSGGSGTAGAILKGDLWSISVGGALGGVAVTTGDVLRALVDAPGQTSTNWVITENNIGYVAENSASKNATDGYAGLTGFSINLRNVANSFTSFLTTAATAVRTWTMPDKSGTVAMTSDITGTNSGTNTGDQDLSTMVTLAGTQTLTNKTLTSPVINGFSGTGNGAMTGNLAVTGALSATGQVLVAPTVGTSFAPLKFSNTGGDYFFAVDSSVGNSFGTGVPYALVQYAPAGKVITTNIGGSVVTTVTSTGLAVTGALSATGKLTLTGTAATVAEASLVSGTTTNAAYHRLTNTGGDGVLGIAGSAGAEILAGGSAYATQLYTVGATALQFGTNSSVKATLDASGNLGLGVTPSPSTLKTIQSQYGLLAGITSSNITANAYYNAGWNYTATGSATLFEQNSGVYNWYTAPSGTAGNAITFTQAMTLDASGNLLVGTTSANAKLHIGATGGSAGQCFRFTGWGGGVGAAGTFEALSTASADVMYFRTSAAQVGSISITSTATSYVTSSDARLKTNIVNAPDAASLIDSIQVRSFDWLSDSSHQRYGMVAQELYEVAPEAVNKPADPDGMMGVDYSKLVPMMLKELQSLRARVAQLEGI